MNGLIKGKAIQVRAKGVYAYLATFVGIGCLERNFGKYIYVVIKSAFS